MFDYPHSLLVEKLREYKSEHKPTATNAVLSTAIGIAIPTLANFLKAKREPRKATTDAIVLFLQRKGKIEKISAL